MTEYYKALRPDGTDFATGTTKPRKGSWMPRIEGDLVMCERGYHVSDAVAETLVGGSWPCKKAWRCNECGAFAYTENVSADDVHDLGCMECGCSEWTLTSNPS